MTSVTVALTNAVTIGLTVKSDIMPDFRRVCRTFVFLVRLFLVSCLFVYYFFVAVCLGRESVRSAANLGSLKCIKMYRAL